MLMKPSCSAPTLFRRRQIFPLLGLMLFNGCAIIFAERRSLVAEIPAGTSSPFSFKKTLGSTTNWIEFDGFQGQSSNQRLKITLLNHGRSALEIKISERNFRLVQPNGSVTIYDSVIGSRTRGLGFFISGIRRSARCEFDITVSEPARFLSPVKVYVVSGGAPL